MYIRIDLSTNRLSEKFNSQPGRSSIPQSCDKLNDKESIIEARAD